MFNWRYFLVVSLAVSTFCSSPAVALTTNEAYVEGYATGYTDGFYSGWGSIMKAAQSLLLIHGAKLREEKRKELKEENSEHNRQDFEIGQMTFKATLEKGSYTQDESAAELKGYAASFMEGSIAGMKEGGDTAATIQRGGTATAEQFKEDLSHGLKVSLFQEANRLGVSPSMALTIIENQMNRTK